MLAAELWQQLQAADAATQRQVAYAVTTMAMDAAPVTNGRAQIEHAFSLGAYGETELRTWLKGMRDAAEAASWEAKELDNNEAEADRQWRQARGYETAYLALLSDAAEAAGEAVYEAAVLVGEEQVTARAQRILA
ncbi:hypothetical protein [Fodinicola acaciae]|uniref:hypothetical protein n=1 Tax=Fodinicola acaciae TaxID=2681555 RepID=UPI0013D3624D|nr:hypothetical protein [Fodinicola acaciae]